MSEMGKLVKKKRGRKREKRGPSRGVKSPKISSQKRSQILETLKREMDNSVQKFPRGYRYQFIADLESLKISIPVKISRVKSKPMIAIERRGPNGGRVEAHYSEKHYYEIIGNNEKHEINPDQIYYVQVLDDGKEEIVEPFERMKEIKIVKKIPMTNIDDYLFEATYELWSEENNLELYELAKMLRDEDVALVALFTFGGYKAYTAVIYPLIRGDKFTIVMGLATSKKEFRAWMPIDKPLTEKKGRRKTVEGAKKPQARLVI